ncbi:MAG: hypothetical protein ACYC3F_16735 [Gemmatimonadaceae bacterium]
MGNKFTKPIDLKDLQVMDVTNNKLVEHDYEYKYKAALERINLLQCQLREAHERNYMNEKRHDEVTEALRTSCLALTKRGNELCETITMMCNDGDSLVRDYDELKQKYLDLEQKYDDLYWSPNPGPGSVESVLGFKKEMSDLGLPST